MYYKSVPGKLSCYGSQQGTFPTTNLSHHSHQTALEPEIRNIYKLIHFFIIQTDDKIFEDTFENKLWKETNIFMLIMLKQSFDGPLKHKLMAYCSCCSTYPFNAEIECMQIEAAWWWPILCLIIGYTDRIMFLWVLPGKTRLAHLNSRQRVPRTHCRKIMTEMNLPFIKMQQSYKSFIYH